LKSSSSSSSSKAPQLQGFIITTNFTTWRTSFRFDSVTPACGITPQDRAATSQRRIDLDGRLAKELEAVEKR